MRYRNALLSSSLSLTAVFSFSECLYRVSHTQSLPRGPNARAITQTALRHGTVRQRAQHLPLPRCVIDPPASRLMTRIFSQTSTARVGHQSKSHALPRSTSYCRRQYILMATRGNRECRLLLDSKHFLPLCILNKI